MAVRGVDVSSWQHPGGQAIDWAACYDSGYRFAVVKATQGVDYVNPWLAEDLDAARAAGLFVGAYHYFAAGVDPAEQARFYVATMLGHRLDLYSWLDYEVGYASNFAASAEIQQFLDAARDGRPGMGLYVDAATLADLRAAHAALPKLWVAAWGAAEAPAGADVWQTEQAADVAGMPAPCDVDVLVRLRGLNIPTAPRPRATAADVAAVHAAAGGDVPAVSPPPPPPPA